MVRKFLFSTVAFLTLLASCTTIPNSKRENVDGRAKNVIFMIVDGMGFEHVKAARIYNGMRPFSFEQFPCKTKVTTCSYAGADLKGHCIEGSSDITDSAAAATAIATGVKVGNGAISRELPKYAQDIETVLEVAKRQQKSTGVIATKLFTDATPAAFVSHANDRDMTDEILRDMFTASMPNVVFGADTSTHRQFAQESKGEYKMVHTSQELAALTRELDGKSCSGDSCPRVYGGFGQHELIAGAFDKKSGLPLEITPRKTYDKLGVPHLSEMTSAALTILSKNQRGFFLMVESSQPDTISHLNKHIDSTPSSPKAVEALIHEMFEVEKTIKVIESFVAKNPDTLVILTADHETGGLTIEMDKTSCLGKDDCVPTVKWTSEPYEANDPASLAQHTNVDVPLYAIGKGAERFCAEAINNIDIPGLALAK